MDMIIPFEWQRMLIGDEPPLFIVEIIFTHRDHLAVDNDSAALGWRPQQGVEKLWGFRSRAT